MDRNEAKSLLSALANGINPITGEILPDDSPYNEPKVIRALFTVLNPVKGNKQPKKSLQEKQQENVAAGRPRNAGLPWTENLKKELARKFKTGAQLDDLSTEFERAKGAVIAELVKQGLVEQAAADEMR